MPMAARSHGSDLAIVCRAAAEAPAVETDTARGCGFGRVGARSATCTVGALKPSCVERGAGERFVALYCCGMAGGCESADRGPAAVSMPVPPALRRAATWLPDRTSCYNS